MDTVPEKQLTAREEEVLEMVAQGYGYGEVAQRLGIARTTLRVHMGRVLRKVGAKESHGAVAWWWRRKTGGNK